jgi:hypothetical protein
MIPPKVAFAIVVVGVLMLIYSLYMLCCGPDTYSPNRVFVGLALTFGGLFLKDLK